MIGGVVIAINALRIFDAEKVNWINLILLTTMATAAQLFKSEVPFHQVYHPSLVFFFAGILILQPLGFVALVVIAHLFEWGKERYVSRRDLSDWNLQLFNIGMHIILGALAGMLFLAINPNYDEIGTLRALTGAGVVACVYIALNHLMVGEALFLVQAVDWKESGVLDIENLATDFVLAMFGFVTAILMSVNPLLILPAITPLYLINPHHQLIRSHRNPYRAYLSLLMNLPLHKVQEVNPLCHQYQTLHTNPCQVSMDPF